MLSAAHRLTDAASFRDATRRGRRAAGRTLVVHLLPAEGPEPARVGFVVSKAVGNAVVRNRVKRRLRHQVRRLIDAVAPGTVVVVRALPQSASADADELARDLVACLGRLGVSRAGVPA